MALSRNAQLVAQALFGLGKVCEVDFHTPSRITPETKAALEELVAAGMVIFKKKGKTYNYHATEKIGLPLWDYARVDENNPAEMFAIVKQS
jgi:hypothetical protein